MASTLGAGAAKSAAGGALLFVTAFLIGAHWGTLGLASAWLVAAPLLYAYLKKELHAAQLV